jgi:hypothetical protein
MCTCEESRSLPPLQIATGPRAEGFPKTIILAVQVQNECTWKTFKPLKGKTMAYTFVPSDDALASSFSPEYLRGALMESITGDALIGAESSTHIKQMYRDHLIKLAGYKFPKGEC